MTLFRSLLFHLSPYAVQKRIIADRHREPVSAEIDRLLRLVWNWKGYRHALVLDDGWQGFGDEEFRTLILKPSPDEWFHLRYCPSRRSAWACIRTPTCRVEFPAWTTDRWLVDRFFTLEMMLGQLPEHPTLVGLFA